MPHQHGTHRTTETKTFKSETGSDVSVHMRHNSNHSQIHCVRSYETFLTGLLIATDSRYLSNKGSTARRRWWPDSGSVECDAAWLGGWFPTFRKIVTSSSPS